MISESNFLAALRSSLGCSDSRMLLVAAVPVSLLRFPFLLNVSLRIRMCAGSMIVQRVLLISRAMSTAAPRFSRGDRICHSLSESFRAEVRDIGAAVLSYAVLLPTVTICFLQLAVCYTWVWGPVIFGAAMTVMLGGALVGSWTFVTISLGGKWKYTSAGVVFCVVCGVAAVATCRCA